MDKSVMNERTESPTDSTADVSKRRRNLILAVVLAVGALVMYASIFLRLSVNPLE